MKAVIVFFSMIAYFGQEVFAVEFIQIPQSNFHRDNIKNVVIDETLNLMWQDDESTAKVTKSWEEAKEYCSQLTYLGFHDWRLPLVSELISLVDENRFSPAINPVFKNVASERYWSDDKENNYEAWRVGFQFGGEYPNNISVRSYVRCVRNNK